MILFRLNNISACDCSFASDDRTPEVFREKIAAATQMRAVLGAERRPNCLVIDEIDGAAQVSFIYALLLISVC